MTHRVIFVKGKGGRTTDDGPQTTARGGPTVT